MTTLPNYKHFDGIHYETGSVHNALAYQGLKMPHTKSAPSEALLLGLSGGITFGYFSFAYKGFDPMVALLTRNTFKPLETMLNRLGAVQNVRQTTDPKKAEKNLLDSLESGQPALVWANRMALPYSTYDGTLGSEMYEMIPVVVYGVDKGHVHIADQSRASLKVSVKDFTKARARVKKEKFRMMTITVPSFDKLAANVDAAIRASVKSFFTSPVKGYASNFGFAAYQRWADVLFNDKDKQSWNKIFPAGRNMFAGLTSAFERIELFGTGGSASRPLYADFLDESSSLINRPALRDGETIPRARACMAITLPCAPTRFNRPIQRSAWIADPKTRFVLRKGNGRVGRDQKDSFAAGEDPHFDGKEIPSRWRKRNCLQGKLARSHLAGI